MKLQELAKHFRTELSALYGDDESQALFWLAIEHLLGLKRNQYLLQKEQQLAPADWAKFDALLKELAGGRPIQYIFGTSYFYGLPFKVNEEVLIPRPETEELVDWIVETVQGLQFAPDSNRGNSLLDIGTGSGCIAVALKKHLPQLRVEAWDIATESLKVAQENAALNQVEIQLMQHDILQARHLKLENPYSIIVSNPPYITPKETLDMHPNVLENEPHRALFVGSEEPLIFYDAIGDFALQNLEKGGLLFFEINAHLGKETVALLEGKGFIDIELRKDMQGKDRMIRCKR